MAAPVLSLTVLPRDILKYQLLVLYVFAVKKTCCVLSRAILSFRGVEVLPMATWWGSTGGNDDIALSPCLCLIALGIRRESTTKRRRLKPTN